MDDEFPSTSTYSLVFLTIGGEEAGREVEVEGSLRFLETGFSSEPILCWKKPRIEFWFDVLEREAYMPRIGDHASSQKALCL